MSAKVSFRVTTYFKRPRGEAGLTQMGTRRISISEALDCILAELPEDAMSLDHDNENGAEVVTIRIDWAKVPPEIRDGLR